MHSLTRHPGLAGCLRDVAVVLTQQRREVVVLGAVQRLVAGRSTGISTALPNIQGGSLDAPSEDPLRRCAACESKPAPALPHFAVPGRCLATCTAGSMK